MKLTYQYKLRPTKEQNATMIEWLNLCRRQYNYRLGQRFQFPTRFSVKLGTVKLEADGWYISLALEDETVPRKEDEAICPTKENSCAIDVGLERFLTCDDGTYVEIPRFLRKASDRLARLQRAKSKLPKGNKDKPKLYKAIAKLHQKIARQRQDFHFAVAYSLFSKADVVFIEDLKLKNLIRRNKPKLDGQGGFLPNNQAVSSGMNKSWLDAAHSQFFKILEWVAWKLGKLVVKIDPWGTSQHCYACLNKVPKTLSDRWHSCICGIEINRDENSAKLQKSVGLGLDLRKIAPMRERSQRSIALQ